MDGNFLFKVVIFFANKKATYYGVPGFRGPYPSIAIATATPPLHAGLIPAQKKSLRGFFLGLQIRKQICALLSRHPWLVNFFQDRNTFLASEKSLPGFFRGLQNRVAILHASKPPSMARYCLACKKNPFPEPVEGNSSKTNAFDFYRFRVEPGMTAVFK